MRVVSVPIDCVMPRDALGHDFAMRMVLVGLLLAVLPIFALHESDAGKVDWYKELIGLPRIESTAVAPRFERSAGQNQRSFIVTVSKSNVIAAVNAVDGDIGV